MTLRERAPRTAWVAGLLLSFAMAGVVIVLFLVRSPSSTLTYVLPALLAAITSFIFAVAWPNGSWRWGIVMSSGFAIFFLVVFLAYLTVRDWDATTLVRAASVLLSGLAGSVIATRVRGASQGPRIGD